MNEVKIKGRNVGKKEKREGSITKGIKKENKKEKWKEGIQTRKEKGKM